MTSTAEQLLFSSALDIRRRFVRLLSILRQAADVASPAERKMIRALHESIRGDLAEYANAMKVNLAGARTMEATDDLSKWGDKSRKRIAKQVSTYYRKFQLRHEDAHTYLSRHLSIPNDLLHFLFRSLELSLVSNTHREAVALYPSRHLMWESSSAGDSALDVTAILVPYSEIGSPTRWPLLVHELGHHLSPEGHSSDAARSKVLAANPLPEPDGGQRDDGLAELQADAIAERATGVTYALALAREGWLLYNTSHFKPGGSTVKQRLESLSYGPEVAAVLPPQWNLDGGRKNVTEEAAQETPDDEAMTELRRLLTDLKITPHSPSRSNVIDIASELMKKHEPIPAVPRLGVPKQDVFEGVALGRPDEEGKALDTWKSNVDAVFGSVADVALTDTEILEAAWIEEMNIDDVIERLSVEPTDDQLEVEITAVENSDTTISRSLQAAAVHRWLLDNDTDIRAAVDSVQLSETADWAEGAEPLENESSPLSDVQLARRLTLPMDHPKRLVVRPIVDPSQVGGTTIDLRLGTEWEVLRTSRFRSLDPGEDSLEVTDRLNESVEEFRLTAGEKHGLVLHPGELMLALTLEYLSLPSDLWGQLEGRSTWARIGLQVHATAGMVDAGFRGFLTLELQNLGPLPLVLYPGLRVGQMAFFPVQGIARPYDKRGGAYSSQSRVRTAFTRQHEHVARNQYLVREQGLETDRSTRYHAGDEQASPDE